MRNESTPSGSSGAREFIDVWRHRSFIVKPVEDLPTLIDIGLARGSFVRAIGQHTGAWDEFVVSVKSVRGTPSFDRAAATHIVAWTRRYHVESPWMLDWLAGAFGYLCSTGDGITSIDDVLIMAAIVPQPDFVAIYSGADKFSELALGWSGDERPPDPISESQDEFLRRMKAAWQRRCDAIGWDRPRTRTIDSHAIWLARHRVGGETIGQILDSYENPPDFSTVKKALKSFQELIELT